MGSATPTLSGGKLFVLGTTQAHSLDAKTGEPVWATPLPDGTSTSSFLVTENLLIARPGTPGEVADAILFLIHNEYMTGTTIDVEGGALLP